MPYEWDEAKRLANLTKHRVDFRSIYSFDWGSAVVRFDDRHNERRWVALSFIDADLYSVAYTIRGDNFRIISLRKADRSEVREYGENQA